MAHECRIIIIIDESSNIFVHDQLLHHDVDGLDGDDNHLQYMWKTRKHKQSELVYGFSYYFSECRYGSVCIYVLCTQC